MWNRILDKIEAVLQWMVRKEGDKAFFWAGWLTVCVIGIGRFTQQYQGLSWRGLLVESAVGLGSISLWFVFGKLLWVAQEHRLLRRPATVIVRLFGGAGVGTIVLVIGWALVIIPPAPWLLSTSSTQSFSRVLSCLHVLMSFLVVFLMPSIGALWNGYRLQHPGYVWGMIFGIWVVGVLCFTGGLPIDATTWLYCVATLILTAVFGAFGEFLAKREHHEIPSAPLPPTTDPMPAP